MRFEPGELAWDDDGSWTTMRSPWIVPASSVVDIAYDGVRDGSGRVGFWMHIDSNGPGTPGVGYIWLGTRDDLWLRLNGIGPVGMDAARLTTVLQRLLVELDGEMARNGAVQPVAVEEPVEDDVQPIGAGEPVLTDTDVDFIARRWDLNRNYYDADDLRNAVVDRMMRMTQEERVEEVRVARLFMAGVARVAEADVPPDDLEEAIAQGHVVIERDSLDSRTVLLTWLRGGWEWPANIELGEWEGGPYRRTPWPIVDVAVARADAGLWAGAVACWARHPAWPAGQAEQEGAAGG